MHVTSNPRIPSDHDCRVVNHIHSLYAAKVAAYARDDKRLEIRLDKEAADHAVYIDTSRPGVSVVNGPNFEARIDSKYLNPSSGSDSYRVESFRSASLLPGGKEQQLRCYFVYKCDFANPTPEPDETRLDQIGDKRFLQKATPNTKAIYQEILDSAIGRTGPVIEYFELEGSREKRLVIAYRQGSAMGFFSALSDLYHYYNLTSSRKYTGMWSTQRARVSALTTFRAILKWLYGHVPVPSASPHERRVA
jgi:glutamate dehydrogenase